MATARYGLHITQQTVIRDAAAVITMLEEIGNVGEICLHPQVGERTLEVLQMALQGMANSKFDKVYKKKY
ncbi:Protein of unknown function [Gryllus bimaculatus]|nr:Protein of unknown function [Gryllus bimaculatus]